jgi:hypothetical protein
MRSSGHGSLVRAVSQKKLVENLQLKPPYKFKKSYGGTKFSTPEPQKQTASEDVNLHPGCDARTLSKILF